jgi:hypothetical protein
MLSLKMKMIAKTHNGNGAFFYPFITIGKNTTLKPLLLPKNNHWLREIEVNQKIGRLRVLVSDDGFVFPVGLKGNTRLFLNVLFVTSLFYDLQARLIAKNSLCKTEWNDNDNKMTITSMNPNSIRSNTAFNRDSQDTVKRMTAFSRKAVSVKKMQDMINKSYEVYQSDFREEIIMVGEAWSFQFDDSSKVGFLYSWMIIEIFLKNEWSVFVDTLSISNSRKSIMKGYWIKKIINQMKSNQIIGKTACKILHILRDKRNDIVHDPIKTKISKKQSQRCLNVATKIFWNRYNEDKLGKGIK